MNLEPLTPNEKKFENVLLLLYIIAVIVLPFLL